MLCSFIRLVVKVLVYYLTWKLHCLRISKHAVHISHKNLVLHTFQAAAGLSRHWPSDVGSLLGHLHLELHPLAHHGVDVIQQLGDGDRRLWGHSQDSESNSGAALSHLAKKQRRQVYYGTTWITHWTRHRSKSPEWSWPETRAEDEKKKEKNSGGG